jgi:hypothetical protein
MTRLVAAILFAALVTNVQAQDATYDPPNVPMDIIAPERPRGTPRQRRVIMPDTTPQLPCYRLIHRQKRRQHHKRRHLGRLRSNRTL